MIELIEFLQGELLLTGTLFALIILLIVNIYSEKFKKYEVVDTNGAVTLMDDDLIILDVREEKERSAGFIDSDLNIPMGQVKSKLDSLDKSKKFLSIVKVALDLIALLTYFVSMNSKMYIASKAALMPGKKLNCQLKNNHYEKIPNNYWSWRMG